MAMLFVPFISGYAGGFSDKLMVDVFGAPVLPERGD